MSLVTKKATIAAFLLCLTIMTLIGLAVSFEFLSEEIAKVYVVPMLIAAFFTSAAMLVTQYVRSLTSD